MARAAGKETEGGGGGGCKKAWPKSYKAPDAFQLEMTRQKFRNQRVNRSNKSNNNKQKWENETLEIGSWHLSS